MASRAILRQRGASLAVFALIAFVSAWLMATSSPVGAAQRVCDPGTVWNERSGTCVEIPEETPTPRPTSAPRATATDVPIEPTEVPRATDPPVRATEEPAQPTVEPEDPIVDPTDSPTEPADQQVAPQAVDEDSNTVIINKTICSEARLVVGDASDCVPMQDVTFKVTYWDGQAFGATDSTGTLAIDEISPGSIEIEELDSADFHPYVFICSWTRYENGQVVETGNPIEADPTNPGYVSVSASEPGVVVQCLVRNVPTDEFSGITIRKIACIQPRSTYDGLSASEFLAEISLLSGNPDCFATLPGIEFTVDDGSGELVLETDDEGIAIWDTDSTNFASVTESIPDGYDVPKMICTGGVWGEAFDATSDEATVTFNMETYEKLGCLWFNFPLEPATGEVTVVKLICPSEPYNIYECVHAGAGTGFTLLQSQVEIASAVTDQSSKVSFPDLAPGEYQIVETTGTPCGMEQVDVPISDGLITVEAGETTGIAVYNCQTPSEGAILVKKYVCPDETLVNEIACNLPSEGFEFSLQQSQVELFAGTIQSSGGLGFVGLAPGAYDLVETNGTPCGIESDQPLVNGQVIVSAGVTTGVSVFNCQPLDPDGDDSGVTILKIACIQPRSTYEGMSVDEFVELVLIPDVDCQEFQPGVEFAVDDSSGMEVTQILTINDFGYANWTKVGTGEVTIKETIPDGYDEPRVFCTDGNFEDAWEVQANNGAIALNLELYPVLDCYWYNFPFDPDGDGADDSDDGLGDEPGGDVTEVPGYATPVSLPSTGMSPGGSTLWQWSTIAALSLVFAFMILGLVARQRKRGTR